MAQHHVWVKVPAPVHEVYALFTHFNDFPKFMSYVREVTYLDDERSHWVADIMGRHEWDAVNEGWIENERIGWRATSGLANSGVVTFAEDGAQQTRLDVTIEYEPPAGVLGQAGEALGGGAEFERRLLRDLEHFANMVREAPEGSLDPTSSTYLFHDDSAAAKGTTTAAQDASSANPGAPSP